MKSQKENNKVDHEIQISKNEDIMYSYESSQIELKNTKPIDRVLSKFLSENYQFDSQISPPMPNIAAKRTIFEENKASLQVSDQPLTFRKSEHDEN